MGEYFFEHSWEQERRRLDLLAELFDPATREHLGRIPVPVGGQCLDVGAGAGSVARWLCERVGPEGRVLATDLETGFLETLPEKNLEVRRHDITAEELDADRFDLIHSRLVFDFFPERQVEVAQRLVRALRPGGWLVLEDFDWCSVLARASWGGGDGLLRVHESLKAVFPAQTPTLGRTLPVTLRAAGLVDVGAEGRTHVALSGGPALAWWRLTLLALRPRLVATGLISEDEFDAVLRTFEADDVCFLFPTMITAWGRRPE